MEVVFGFDADVVGSISQFKRPEGEHVSEGEKEGC